MCRIICCFILVVVYLTVIDCGRLRAKVFFKCYKRYERFCARKKDNFRFNDGCNMCHCMKNRMLCPKGRCKYFTSIRKKSEYCRQIRKENEKRYMVSVTSPKYMNHKIKNVHARNWKLTWPKSYGSSWYHNYFQRSTMTKTYYLKRLKSLKKRLKFQRKMFNKLKKKKKELLKKYKKTKSKYKTSKINQPYSYKTWRLKNKMRKLKLQYQVIKRRLKYYYKQFRIIKKSITKLKNKIKKSTNKKSRKKSTLKKYKFKSNLLKRLRELYKKNKKRYQKLNEKRQKLIWKNKIQKEKNEGKLQNRLKRRQKLSEIIRRIRKYMKKIKEKYLKSEGNKKLKKHEKIKERKKFKKEMKKRIWKKKKLIKPHINKDRRVKITKKKDKKWHWKEKFNPQHPKMKKKYKKILKKEKKGHKIRIKPISPKERKKYVLLDDKIKKEKAGHKKTIPIKIFYKKRMARDRRFLFEKKNNRTKGYKKAPPKKKRALNDLIDDNQKITKNINVIKNYFKNHFQSQNSKAERSFTEKLKEIIPVLRKFNYTSEKPNVELLRKYANNKDIHLTPIQLVYLRMINNNIYKKYLQLSRLSLLEQRMHHQLQLSNKKSEYHGQMINRTSGMKYSKDKVNMIVEDNTSSNSGAIEAYNFINLMLVSTCVIILCNH